MENLEKVFSNEEILQAEDLNKVVDKVNEVVNTSSEVYPNFAAIEAGGGGK